MYITLFLNSSHFKLVNRLLNVFNSITLKNYLIEPKCITLHNDENYDIFIITPKITKLSENQTGLVIDRNTINSFPTVSKKVESST